MLRTGFQQKQEQEQVQERREWDWHWDLPCMVAGIQSRVSKGTGKESEYSREKNTSCAWRIWKKGSETAIHLCWSLKFQPRVQLRNAEKTV